MLTSRVVSVDPRILRILNLQANTEIDYQTYASMLKQAATASRGTSTKMTTEEAELITQEFRKARSNAVGVGGRIKLVPIKVRLTNINAGSLRRNTSQAATASPTQPLLPAAQQDVSILNGISKSLANVVQLLTQQNKQVKGDAEVERKQQEDARRRGLETNLEQGFVAAKNIAKALVAPVRNILEDIINYFMMIFLGRAVISLLNWFADPQNQSKVKSILRFLKDWWPTLLSAYILFGTGFGKAVRKLAGVAVGAVSRLIIITARLAKAIATGKGLKGAAAALATGGAGAGWKGALVKLGVGALATVGTTMAVNKMMGGEDTGISVPEAPANPILAQVGGGLASLGSLFGSLSSSASESFAPFTSFFSNGGLASVMQGLGGVVRGQKGIDRVPAMLTDGEFVMSRGAVQKFGVNTLMSMNSAGGGTNIPKIVSGKVYAYGGGPIGDVPESFTQSSRTAAGLTDLEKNLRLEEKITPRYAENLPKLNTPRLKIPRQPIPKNLAIVPYTGGGLVRSGVTGGLSEKAIPQIRTNMKVPGGFGNFKSLGVGMLSEYLVSRGFDKVNAMIVASKIDQGRKLDGPEKQNYIESLRTIIEREERWQKGFGGIFDKIVGLGKETSSEKMSKNAREILQGIGADMYQGGSFVGGKGLKQQSFKDMPKTQIMTDDKGRPFVGYKAMRGGKPVYVRGPQPGTGTTNPFEALGRMINPGAYKESDAKIRMRNQKIAMVNSLESLQARGASLETQSKMMKQMGGNIKDVQNDLTYRKNRIKLAKTTPNRGKITPTPKPQPKVVKTGYKPAGGGMNGGRGSGSNPSVPKIPSSSGSNRKTKNIYGIK